MSGSVAAEGSNAGALPTAEEKYNAAVDFPGAQLEVLPLYEEVVPGFVNKVPVLFQFVTGSTSSGRRERAPFSLCIVLDTSGSMCGGPLDSCKKAILQLLGSVGDNDRVSLVTYSSRARVEFANVRCGESGMREKMAARVKSIGVDGSTNLWAGIEVGYEVLVGGMKVFTDEVDGSYPPGRSDTVSIAGTASKDDEATKLSKHLFVLSDGHVNEGKYKETDAILRAVEAFEEPIPILSYGIGDGFNEKLMTPLGKVHRGGHYFYLSDDASIEKLIARGVRSLTDVAANDIGVSVRPLPGGGAGELWFPDSAIDGWQYSRIREKSVLQWTVELEIRPAIGGRAGEGASQADMDGFVDVGSSAARAAPPSCPGLAFEWKVHGQFPGLKASSGVVRFRPSETRAPNEEVKTFVEVKRACELRKTACASEEGGSGAQGGARKKVEEAQKVFKARMAVHDRFGFAQEWSTTTQTLLDDAKLWTSSGAATSAAAKNLGYHTGGDEEEEEEDEMDFDLFG